MFLVQNVMTDIFGKTKLLRRDQDKADALISDQSVDQRVDRTPEFQISAQTDRHIAETPLQIADRQQVGQCLRRVLVSSVSGIDDRDGRVLACDHGRSFFRMSHCTDIRIA